TPPPSTSTLPSPPTTRVATPSASSGGCLPVRSSASGAPSSTVRPSGTSWSICTSVSFHDGSPIRPEMHISWLDHMLTCLPTLDRDPEAEAEEKIEEEKVAAVEEETAVVETGFAAGDWEAAPAGF